MQNLKYIKYINLGFEPRVFLRMSDIVNRLKLKRNISKGKYVNLAVDILNTMLENKTLPDDLAALLAERNPSTLKELQALILTISWTEEAVG